jgi:hypothetical protein
MKTLAPYPAAETAVRPMTLLRVSCEHVVCDAVVCGVNVGKAGEANPSRRQGERAKRACSSYHRDDMLRDWPRFGRGGGCTLAAVENFLGSWLMICRSRKLG